MGVPKFASLIRTKYRGCWNNPGDVKFDKKTMSFAMKKKNVDFRHLLIDGNSLLHMAFQFTFGYGGKVKLTPEHKKFLQTSSYEEIFDQAVKNFCNSIDNMIETLQIQGSAFLVFDGPAPLAKMVQQRQRRYGKYYSVENDNVFKIAMKKERDELIGGMNANDIPNEDMDETQEQIAEQIRANQIGKSNKVIVDLPSVFEDVINRPFPNGGKFYVKEQAGGDSTKVLKNLVAWSKEKKMRWTNILNPNAPHTVEVSINGENKKFMCVFHAAIYMVYKEQNPDDILLDSLIVKPDTPASELNKFKVYFSTDGFQIPASESIFNSSYYRTMEIFEKTRDAFMRINNARINKAIYVVSSELAKTNALYKETLMRSGDSILMSNGKRLDWLMELRGLLVQNELQMRIYGQDQDMGKLLDELIEKNKTADQREESDYRLDDIYFAEEDDQTHLSSRNFDSNSLTPGTSEMKRIAKMIREHYEIKFVKKAPYGLEIDMGTYKRKDSRNKKIDIYFSDSSIPGEGEQKLMQLFRSNKFTETESDEMDLFYGLDADLFVLTIIRCSTFKNYQCGLLREEEMVRANFMPPTDKTSFFAQKGLTYHIADVATLTSMIGKTIHPHDFVFLTFMFGNDFLPRSPLMSYENMTTSETGSSVFEQAIKMVGLREESAMISIDKGELKLNMEELVSLLGKLKNVEQASIENLYKLYQQEKRIRESNRAKTIENLSKEMVPLNLKYDMVLKSTVVSQIWKVKGIDETVKRVNDINYPRFRANWESHLANGFPGYQGKMSSAKKDVLAHACMEYLAGLKWIACYYFDAMGRTDVPEIIQPEGLKFILHPDHLVDISGDEDYIMFKNSEKTITKKEVESLVRNKKPEDIINRARNFVRDNISMDNVASNDAELSSKCCWDVLTYADAAVINTVQTSAHYKLEGPYNVWIDMAKEKFAKDQNVYADSSDRKVLELTACIRKMSNDGHYINIYVVVEKNHYLGILNEKPEIVVQNDEFILLKFRSGSNASYSFPTEGTSGVLSPFWYYPYLVSPLIASVYDTMTNMNLTQETIDSSIMGNPHGFDSVRLESLWAVNSDIQCYAVLPPQSGSLYPMPLVENDVSTWQFPVKITTRDYNFKGWVHEGALSVPPMDLNQLMEQYE